MSDTPPISDEHSTPDVTEHDGGGSQDSSALDISASDAPPEHVKEDCAKAPLNRKWSIKLFIITFLVVGFGAYGLYDATLAYPERGKRFASWAQWQYLDAAKAAGSEEFGIFERQTSIQDPVAEFERLSNPETRQRNATDAQNQSSSRHLRATMYNTRFQWLKSLKTVNMLSPEHTTFDSPADELEAGRAKWTSSTSNPKPLKGYDIPSQWAIMIICWFIGGWMILNIIKVVRQKYSWDASTMTITVPGPISINPDHLVEVDKRKWDKFIVFLKLNDSHPSHAGKEIKVDTYQHALVEDWILAMEAKAEESQEND
ncbi:MAG: hypothetical protein AB8C13_04590 [Phycisphaerales bacterium]